MCHWWPETRLFLERDAVSKESYVYGDTPFLSLLTKIGSPRLKKGHTIGADNNTVSRAYMNNIKLVTSSQMQDPDIHCLITTQLGSPTASGSG